MSTSTYQCQKLDLQLNVSLYWSHGPTGNAILVEDLLQCYHWVHIVSNNIICNSKISADSALDIDERPKCSSIKALAHFKHQVSVK